LKLFGTLLFCLLAVCLASSEFSELSTLLDDPSNDFVIQHNPGDGLSGHAIIHAAPSVEPGPGVSNTVRFDAVFFVLLQPVPDAVQDPLQFSTIRRT
jgi:hypothetical protein